MRIGFGLCRACPLGENGAVLVHRLGLAYKPKSHAELGRSFRKVSRELARIWSSHQHKRRRRTNQLPSDLQGLGERSGTLADAGLRKRQLSLRRPRLCRCGRPKRPGTLAGDVAQCRGARCRQDLGRRVRGNGSGFAAEMSIRSSNRRQTVVMRPRGGDIDKVDINLSRES